MGNTRKEMLTVREVAEWTSLGRSSIWRLVKDGSFPRPVKVSPGATRWRRVDLEQWRDGLSGEARA